MKNNKFPILVERDEDGVYAVECPLFKGCYTQGNSLDEALSNLEQALKLDELNKSKECLELAKNDTDFASIRDDPRFQNLLTKFDSGWDGQNLLEIILPKII